MKEETIELLNRIQETKEIIGRDLTADETILLKLKGFDYIMNDYFQISKELRDTLKHANQIISLYCSGNKKDYLKELSYESCINLSKILDKISSDLKNTTFNNEEPDRNKFTGKESLDDTIFSEFEDPLTENEKEVDTSDLKPLNTELNGNEENTNLKDIIKTYIDNKKFDSIPFTNLIPKINDMILSLIFPKTIPAWMPEDMIKKDFIDIVNRMDIVIDAYKECVNTYRKRLGIEVNQ